MFQPIKDVYFTPYLKSSNGILPIDSVNDLTVLDPSHSRQEEMQS